MEEEQTATEQTSDTLLDQAEPTLGEGEFFLSDGIKGNGDMPDWYNSNKYKSISEQAKAYSDLEKKFGGFTGAPKDGYESPEGIESDDALLSELNEFAAKTNMSQDAYNDAWQLLSAQDQAVNAVNQEDELAKLGDNAHTRIKTVEGFMKNNLSPELYEEARELVTDANSIKLVEMLVKATSPVKLPIDGGESPTGITWPDIEVEMFKKHENGELLRSISPEHEKKIKRMQHEWGGDKPNAITVG